MLTSVIIDDEKDAVGTLTKLITKYCPEVVLLGCAYSALEGIKEIQKHKPDLVFLDIQMPGGTGFDVLEALPNRKFQVIFTTAHEQHALKAIKFELLDYLLKPIDTDELIAAVQKAINRAPQFLSNNNDSKTIKLQSNNGFIITKISDILYCKADGSYVHFYLQNGTNCIVSGQLTEFTEQFSSQSFFRIHSKYLINLAHLKEYNKKNYSVILSDSSTLPVSVRRRSDFFKLVESLNQ